MNKILQQRIEEEARKEREQCREDNNEIWRGNPTYNDVEASFIKGATLALQNQWISVEEALPEIDGHGYSKPILVMSDTNELLVATYSKVFNKWNSIGPLSYHRLVVKHWMPIPSLEGGEE